MDTCGIMDVHNCGIERSEAILNEGFRYHYLHRACFILYKVCS
jgi:hypothetical protein